MFLFLFRSRKFRGVFLKTWFFQTKIPTRSSIWPSVSPSFTLSLLLGTFFAKHVCNVAWQSSKLQRQRPQSPGSRKPKNIPTSEREAAPYPPRNLTMPANQKDSDFVGTVSLKFFKTFVGLLGTLFEDSCESCLGTLSRIVFLCSGTLFEKLLGTFSENPVCSNAVFYDRQWSHNFKSVSNFLTPGGWRQNPGWMVLTTNECQARCNLRFQDVRPNSDQCKDVHIAKFPCWSFIHGRG